MTSKRLGREQPKARCAVPSVRSMISEAVKEIFGGAKKSKRKPSSHSRSFAPAAIYAYEAEIAKRGWSHEELTEREEFFDEPRCTSKLVKPIVKAAPIISRSDMAKQPPRSKAAASTPGQPADSKWSLSGRKKREKVARKVQRAETREVQGRPDDKGRSAERKRGPPPEDSDSEDDTVFENFVEIFDNSDRQQHGLGLIRKIFGGVELSKDFKPRRPYFTWWVTLIQILIFIVSAVVYGIAPIGITSVDIEGEVLTTSLVIEKVSYKEQANMWIGPREDDLIHLGARFSPCMRRDVSLVNAISCDRAAEKETACCIYNDGRGCLQQKESQCPNTLATWKKWTVADPGYQNRTSGSVCDQDPKYCKSPSSSGAFVWKDDITQWPVCIEKENASSNAENSHLNCDVVGRPCCLGIQGECIITTREYCEFRRGYFHDSETLCSQVSCFEEVCGLFPFGDPEIPDQFYRLFFSMFLHPGVFSLLVTVLFQFMIMRDLERISGWWRMTIIYIGGGVAGSLASAIFLPYHVEAGPSGAQFAVIAALIVEIFRWNKDGKPYATVGKIIVMLIVLFAVGLLPGIDNYAHLFGFLYGLFLSISFRPYKSLCNKPVPKAGQIACGIVAFALAVVVFVILIVFFYVTPVYECDMCSYFNCIPFTADFCESMTVSISKSRSECSAA